MAPGHGVSLRSRFLLLVLFGVVLPLALAGWWVARSALEAQVEAIEQRLEESLDQAVRQIQNSWISTRSYLLDLGEEWIGSRAIAPAERAAREEAVREALSERYKTLSAAVQWIALDDSRGGRLWEVRRTSFDPIASGLEPAIVVRQPLYELVSGAEAGVLEAEILMGSLLEGSPTEGRVAGLLLAAIDLESGASLLPLPFDPSLLNEEERLAWGGSEWLVSRRELSEPPVALVALAPLTPVVAPLEQAARRGLWLLIGVALVAFTLAGVVTGRLTRSLEKLGDAAAGVSRGDLDLQVDVVGDDEVGRLGQAFNRMTQSLRSTLRELSRRETLAAVGELAASLSHEVRNILTSIKLDLQRVEEQLPEDGSARQTQRRALSEVARLDATVTTTLQMARSSRFEPEVTDVRRPLTAAIHAAMPEIEARSATLERPTLDDEIFVSGEADGLEQVFLNLLLNAAQAVGPGGRVEVRVEEKDSRIVVSFLDDGEGMTEEQRSKIFEPFYSTRPEGTGLGLAVVQRIVRLHEGEIVVESAPGSGTEVRLELPRTAVDPARSV